jgi:hypothetical protein
MADYLVISEEKQKLIAKATKQDRYRIFVVAKTSFEVVLERETTVSCTNFLAVCDHYARRFSFRMCIGGIFPCQKLLQVVVQ